MSVSVDYPGRFGNHIFQYAFCRLFAERNKLALNSVFPEENLLATTAPSLHPAYTEPFRCIQEDEELLDRDFPAGRYKLRGWFQNAGWYVKNKVKVRDFFKLPPVQVNDQDLVMHVRLGDYRYCWGTSRVIAPEWYAGILKTETFKRLYIVTESPDECYIRNLRSFEPVVLSGRSLMDDFHFLRSFKRVICSNSTFAWWAAFLGQAEKTYVFRRWVGQPEVKLTRFAGSIEVDGDFIK